MNPSLRSRLLLTILVLFVFGWLSVILVTYAVVSHRINDLFNAELAQDARVLSYLARTGLADHKARHGITADALPTRHPELIAFQVWDGPRLVLQSADTPGFPGPAKNGFRNVEQDGQTWHVYTQIDPTDGLGVVVAEPTGLRDQLTAEFVRDSIYPLLLATPLLAVLIWFGVGRGLAPMARLEQQVDQRSPEFLQPVSTDEVPEELLPLIDRLNALLQRLQDALETERRFTSDAAHEIRTPLAAIRTHAQVAMRAPNADTRQTALSEIVSGVDRTAHMVEQLLTLARLDHEAMEQGFETVDLGQLVQETAASIIPYARDRSIDLQVDVQGPIAVRGNRITLQTLLRNLLDNAVRYSPAGGTVSVNVQSLPSGEIQLAVEDSGPGIPVELRQRVFDRFYRAAPSGTSGCGLGLSICDRIADLHRARIEFDASARFRGLCALIRFLTPAGAA
ncbi:MAG: ATP-binding protein [Acidiferrobacteraceae bacterium]